MSRAPAAAHVKPHPHEKPHHPHWPLAALVFGFVLLLGLFSVHETATWLDIRTGAWIIAHRAIPSVDSFSYTMAGRPWTTDSWLSDGLFFLIDRALGPAGLIALKAVVAAAGFALLLPLNPASPLIGAGVLSLGAVSAWMGLTERPAIFDLLLLALMIRALRPRRAFGWKNILPAAAIELAWANLHGATAVLGVWLIALKAFKGTLRSGKREARAYAGLLAAAFLALLCNPHGWDVIPHMFQGLEVSTTSWQPLSPWVSLYGLFSLVAAAACCVTLQQEFFLTVTTATLLALGLLLPELRALSILASCPTIALALGHFMAPLDDSPQRVAKLAAVLAALFGLHWLCVYMPLGAARGYGAASIDGALQFLSTNGLRGRLFNEPGSGAMVMAGSQAPVFSDERASLYDPSFLSDARAWPGSFGQLSQIYGLDYALILNRRARYPARVIDEDPSWRRVYADDDALVYVRRAGIDGWLAGGAPKVLAPNALWPDSLDALLAKPATRAQALAELDGWIVQSPDGVEALLWKAYALDRLDMPGKADRLLALAEARARLWRDPELLACAAYVHERRGAVADARRLYARVLLLARRRGDQALEQAVLQRAAALAPGA